MTSTEEQPAAEEEPNEVVLQAVDNNTVALRRQVLSRAQPEYIKNATTGMIEFVEFSRQLEEHIPARILYKPWQDDLIEPYGMIMALSIPKLIESIPVENLDVSMKKCKTIVSWLARQYVDIAKGFSPLSDELIEMRGLEDAPKLTRVKNIASRKEKGEAFMATVGVRLIARVAATEKAQLLLNQPIQLTLAAQAKLRRYGPEEGTVELLAQENLSYHWTQLP